MIPAAPPDRWSLTLAERELLVTLRARCPELEAVTVAYITGWRVPSELQPMQWHQVDLGAGTYRHGRPIRDFRKAWAVACRDAGLAGRIPHDLRRTAVRNLERAGVPRLVAMKMVGHKTEAIYRRYALVDEAMLREGSEMLALLVELAGSSREPGQVPVQVVKPRSRRALPSPA
jgi:integrase